MNGLGEQVEFMSFGARLLQDIHYACLAGEQYDVRLRTNLSKDHSSIDAIQFWHHDIGNDDIGTFSPRGINSGVSIVKSVGLVAAVIQNLDQAVRDIGFIVNHENQLCSTFVFMRLRSEMGWDRKRPALRCQEKGER